MDETYGAWPMSQPHGPNGTCLWCGGGFYGPKEPLFVLGQRVKVRDGSTSGGHLSFRAGHAGVIVAVDRDSPKSRYQIKFDDGRLWTDYWADIDLEKNT